MNFRLIVAILFAFLPASVQAQDILKLINFKCSGITNTELDLANKTPVKKTSKKTSVLAKVRIFADNVVVASIRFPDADNEDEIAGSETAYRPELILYAKTILNDDWVGASKMSKFGSGFFSEEIRIDRKTLKLEYKRWISVPKNGEYFSDMKTFAGMCESYVPDTSKNKF